MEKRRSSSGAVDLGGGVDHGAGEDLAGAEAGDGDGDGKKAKVETTAVFEIMHTPT